MNLEEIAKNVIATEAKEIRNLGNNISREFGEALKEMHQCTGKIVVSGIGKSGIIGQKISATLSSTGAPSFFLHPAEAYHGDLGMVGRDDVLLCLSYSGETDEILRIIPFFKKSGNLVVSMTGHPKSTLARNSDFHFNVHVGVEACPLQLAPTSSTTATLVMGDAIAVTLMKLKNFREHEFAKFHPGGSLGRMLLTSVKDVMKDERLPVVKMSDALTEVVHAITAGMCGLTAVLDEKKKIAGVITDGDIRRCMQTNQDEFFTLSALDVMTQNPIVIDENCSISDAELILKTNNINTAPVMRGKRYIGIVTIHMLL